MASTLKTYLTTFYRSIFSPQLYADVIHRWKGLGVLYLLFLSFFMAFFVSSITFFFILKDDVNHLISQVPSYSINEKQEIIINEELPYEMKARSKKDIEYVFVRFVENINPETVGEENPNTIFVVDSEKYVVLVENKSATSKEDISVRYLQFKNSAVKYLNTLKDLNQSIHVYLFIVFFLAMTFGGWLVYFVYALSVATISYVVTAFMKEEYIFETRMRMSAVALTPIILINQLSELLLHHKLNFVMMAAMATLYIFVMIKTSRNVEG